VLNGTLALYDVPDVEELCVKILARYCTKTRTRLRPEDFDDGVAYLIGEAWRLSEKFDASRGARFSSVAYSQLTFRCVDYQRKLLRRTRWKWSPEAVAKGSASKTEYERDRLVPLSLDAPTSRSEPSGPSLGETLAGREGDPAGDRDPYWLARLLEGRGCSTPWRQIDDDRGMSVSAATRARRERERKRRTRRS